MSFSILKFEINGLHGITNISIPIKDNKLIIVGVNGAGKTTVVNILYYSLTRQWAKLDKYNYKNIKLYFKGRKTPIVITPDDINIEHLNFKNIPIRYRNLLNKPINKDILTDLVNKAPTLARDDYMAHRLATSVSIIRRLRNDLTGNNYNRTKNEYNEQLSFFNEETSNKRQKLENAIDKHVSETILYLPTYRRIEQDLKSIFPHLEDDYKRSFDKAGRLINKQSEGYGYLELVRFGMEDVEQKISKVCFDLREEARAELNNLAGSYLRDVIRGEATTYDTDDISTLKDNDIDKILSRVEERTLTHKDKNTLRKVINKLKEKANVTIKTEERYLAHYFSKLIENYKAQQEKETVIRDFITTCNSYLKGKSLIYDYLNYNIYCSHSSGQELSLKDLSSGEKQIVSLFSHLYLSNFEDFIVLIDEPELSLSVDWQTKLLPDIVSSGKCILMVSVTHSPYVFDNNLSDYAVDLNECIA